MSAPIQEAGREMTKAMRCPKCGEAPVVTKQEDFLDADAVTWSIFHVCKKGFNVDEGPCISEHDAIEAWNYHVEEAAKGEIAEGRV